MLLEPVVFPLIQAVQNRTKPPKNAQVKIGARALLEPDADKRMHIEPDASKRTHYEPPVREGEVGRVHGCVHTAWFYLSNSSFFKKTYVRT